MHSRILITGLTCLFLSACDEQQKIEAINVPIENKAAPAQVIKDEPIPARALKLSIDNISIDDEKDNGIFESNKEPLKAHSNTFNTLTRAQAEPDYNFSGKFFTDEERIQNKEYFKSIDGLQINIEGNF